jgi:hypothetical protein
MLKKVSVILFYSLALIFILDFSLTGKEIVTEVDFINSERQNYYNAGGNSHISYTVNTKEVQFVVSKEFAKKIKQGDFVTIKESILFNEVNSYRFNDLSETHSLRLFSGLILPLLVILIIIAQTKFHLKISALSLIFKIMLVGNLIYVIFN